MQLEINVIDAFTDRVFKGNSAAVIITEEWLKDELMQSIAMENNLSETAFIVADKAGAFNIRWFSPLTEIDFCGHATLASAFLLFKKFPDVTQIQFFAKAVGTLTVTQNDDGKIQMDFPNTQPKKITDIPKALADGLSITPVDVYKNAQAYFVIYDRESDVLNVARDNELLAQLAPLDIVVTCQSESSEYDFISRYFWPANGGDEDPVTGSIHTGLAPLWAAHLHKNKLTAYQASSRGGVLECEVNDDRVVISGHAAHYLTGTITV